jgi:hypothetical protein
MTRLLPEASTLSSSTPDSNAAVKEIFGRNGRI